MPVISLLLHNIRSTHNVGAIFRTAEGFGVKHIILTGYTPYPYHKHDTRLPHLAQKITKQIHKTALGAESLVPFTYYESLDEFMQMNSLPILALEQSKNSIKVGSVRPPDEFILAVGEEVYGIQSDFLKECDQIIEIPMSGQKESFNVSVATGIALYALTSIKASN
jgi:23S rRNA (guanosine2251-2'-O)-methyltransferase